MSFFESRPPHPITHYRHKCDQHLRRTLASYDLACRALTQITPEAFVEAHPGVFDNDVPTDQKLHRMRSILAKSHFVLLKVELELFLHLLGLEAWRVALWQHRLGKAELAPKAAKRLSECEFKPGSLLSHDDVVEAMCSAVVPNHGLDRICKAIDPLGLSICKTCNQADPRIWPQVATAFEVRHLVEHRNGRIDADFRVRTKGTWRRSTWGERAPELSGRVEIEILDLDVRGTATQMLGMVDALRNVCEQYDAVRRKLQGVDV